MNSAKRTMMAQTSPLGYVSAVETDLLTIQLDASASPVKAGPSGLLEAGRINSYVVVPSGPQRLVAVVTALRVIPELMPREEPSDVRQSVNRELRAVLVGRIDSERYLAGISLHPPLYAPVYPATSRDIEIIFRPGEGPSVDLGTAVGASDQAVRLDANVLLSHHCAIVGSTGAGKSCSVVALLEGLLSLDIPNANIVILDTTGEYAAAFPPESPFAAAANVLVIGPDPGAKGAFMVPHWFMDSEYHISLLRASGGAQAPVLQRAVVDARLGAGAADASRLTRIRIVLGALENTSAVASAGGRKPQETLSITLAALEASLQSFHDLADQVGDEESVDLWDRAVAVVTPWRELDLRVGNDAWDVPLSPQQQDAIGTILEGLRQVCQGELDRLGLGAATAAYDFDAPRYYSLQDLATIYLRNRIEMEAINEPRIRNYCATMLMRLSRLLADSRYDFMTRVPAFPDALTRFLRLILGRDPLKDLIGHGENPLPPWAAAYERRRRDRPSRHSVTIVDLSAVATDVLENVTGLLGRLLLDFVQKIEDRGSLPILLVLEEAHRYVPSGLGPEQPRSAVAFDRIAKEGRKYGLALFLVSQRPSELSKTVLSQCGTLVAHRITNPDDQDLIRHATPFASREILRQLPGLATQHAVVLGEAVSVPSYVRIADVRNRPRSSDPDFVGHWQIPLETYDDSFIDTVSRAWEQEGPSQEMDEVGP